MRKRERNDVFLLTDAEEALTDTAPKEVRDVLKNQTISEILRMTMNLESDYKLSEASNQYPLTLGEEIALKTIRLYAKLAGKQDSSGRPLVRLQDLKILSELTEGKDKRSSDKQTKDERVVIDLDTYMKNGSEEE